MTSDRFLQPNRSYARTHANPENLMSTTSTSDNAETKFVSWLGQAADSRRLALLAFLFGAAVTLMYRPLSQPEVGDSSLYDYIAQCILRGQLSYRDVIDI